PCPRSGGDAKRREHGFGRLADANVIVHAAPVGEEEIDSLGTVHGAAATDGDDKVNAMLGGHGQSALNMLSGWVFFNAIKHKRCEIRFGQAGKSSGGMTRRLQAGIGDQQDTATTELTDAST